jgi:integrase
VPIGVGDFVKMLGAVRQVVGVRFARDWRRYLRGLWLSGLRREESMRLSWDAGAARIDLAGEYPAIRWGEGGQKNQAEGRTIIAPDFARWLARVPPARRRGPVFPLRIEPNGRLADRTTVSRVVAEIGRASGVVSAAGKSPTAHDLRRSFGTRWALKVPPAALCALMRHSDISTTMKYYVDLQATGEIGRLLYPDRGKK